MTTQQQFAMVVNAVGDQFRQQTNKRYYLTLSPAVTTNLDATRSTTIWICESATLFGIYFSPGFCERGNKFQIICLWGRSSNRIFNRQPGFPGQSTKLLLQDIYLLAVEFRQFCVRTTTAAEPVSTGVSGRGQEITCGVKGFSTGRIEQFGGSKGPFLQGQSLIGNPPIQFR